MKFFLFLSILFFLHTGCFSQIIEPLPFVGKFLSSKALEGATVGLVVDDLAKNETLISVNPDLLLAPASVTKIVTSAVALELLGSNFTYITRVGYNGKIDEKSGVLAGDWVIRGGGDPTMESAWFKKSEVSALDNIVELMNNLNLKTIHGDIVLDLSMFEPQTMPGSWTWEDMGNYFGTTPAALNIGDNTVKLSFNSPSTAGKATQLVSVAPNLPNMGWKNEVLSSTVNRDMAYVYGSPWDNRREIKGTIPAGRQGFEVKASMPNPPLVFGGMLIQKLRDAGIALKGGVKCLYEPVEAHFVGEVLSPSLPEICKIMNHESVNLIGESLVLQLALLANGKGVHDDGLRVVQEYLETHIFAHKFFIVDGSGLSRFNAMSARQLTDLLKFMHHSENGAAFKSSLPNAGVATLRGFDTQKFPGRTLCCKSGSLTRVRAYSGYLVTNSGRTLAFTVMANNFSGTSGEVFAAIGELLGKIRETM